MTNTQRLPRFESPKSEAAGMVSPVWIIKMLFGLRAVHKSVNPRANSKVTHPMCEGFGIR